MNNKKLFSFFFLLMGGVFLFLSNCSKDLNPLSGQPNYDLRPHANIEDGQIIEPVMSGTFIDFWDKENWSATKWDSFVKEMKATGVDTIVVQFAAYDNECWYYSPAYAGSSENYIHALPRLLYAASINGMDVYVGLYFNSAYWNKTVNSSWLQAQASKNKTMASEIWSQYGGYMSFKGWYIAYEPAPYYYNNKEKMNILKNSLINPIANYCKSISGKSVALSVFANQNLSSTTAVIYFMKYLASANLDIIMFQDGVGVNHISLNNLGSYYNAVKWGLYGEGHFSGKFWIDSEIFNSDNTPATISRVTTQFGTASWYAEKIVSFQYYEHMCPTGPNGSAAAKLRNDYLDYVNGL